MRSQKPIAMTLEVALARILASRSRKTLGNWQEIDWLGGRDSGGRSFHCLRVFANSRQVFPLVTFGPTPVLPSFSDSCQGLLILPPQ
jgi:hypothetical protein